jgi:type IV secretion system protein TrbL
LQWVGNAANNTLSWFSTLGSPSAAAAKATGTLWQALSNASTGLQSALEALFVMICCVLGMLAMWIMWLLQQVLAEVCFAVSPIFLGCLLIPPLGQMAARFFTNYIAVLCWPIGWGIANLVTVALLNLALNPSNNTGLGVWNFFGGGFIWWTGVGLWALFSSFAAPWLVTKALSAGEHPLISLFSAGVNTAQTSISIATSAVAPMTGQASTAGSLVAGTMAVPKSFASRPVSNSSNGSSPAKRS